MLRCFGWIGPVFGAIMVAVPLTAQEHDIPPGGKFQSGHDGLSLTLPADWAVLPDDALKLVAQSLMKNPEEAHYKFAFYSTHGDFPLDYPYMIMQVIPYKGRQPYESEFERVGKMITGVDITKEFKKHGTEEAQQLLSGIKIHGFAVEKENRRILVNTSAEIAEVGKVRTLMWIYFGRRASYHLNFSAREDQMGEYQPVFQACADSFRLDHQTAYDDSKATGVDRWQALGRGIGGLAGMIGALLVILYNRKTPPKPASAAVNPAAASEAATTKGPKIPGEVASADDAADDRLELDDLGSPSDAADGEAADLLDDGDESRST